MNGRCCGGMTLLTVAALASCAVGPNYHAPDVAVPGHYAAVPAKPAGATTAPAPSAAPPIDLAGWWHALGDPELDSLVDRAIKANPDLEIALDRLQAARTYESAALGIALPSAQASAGAGRGTGSDLTRSRVSPILGSGENGAGVEQVNVLAGFDAVWELDVFGKFRREIEAARDDTSAAAYARNAVLVSVIADVARAYVDLRGLQARDAVLRASIDVMEESLRIVRIRYERGITNELDVTLAQRELGVLQAQLAPLEAQISAAQYTLATLLGRYPEELVAELAQKAMVPAVPAGVAPGLPLELLRRRPDVQQAERELAGATARIGVAAADLFPRLAVTASVGAQQQGFGRVPVIGQHIWAAGPAALWPLLDFGQLDAQVQIADLQARALLVSYKKTIQGAVSEVDSALDAYAAQQDSLMRLSDALMASQRALTLANERYERGLTDFLNVVDAERQEYEIEQEYTLAQVVVAEQFVALYRALGGGWQSYQALPPIRRPLPAVVALFREVLSRGDPLKEPPGPAAAP